jgi:hypothetical protein
MFLYYGTIIGADKINTDSTCENTGGTVTINKGADDKAQNQQILRKKINNPTRSENNFSEAFVSLTILFFLALICVAELQNAEFGSHFARKSIELN